MLRQSLMLLPVFLAGLVIGAWALSSAPLEPIPAAVPGTQQSARDFDQAGDYERLEQMIESLTQIVNLEVDERRRLETEVASLADAIEKLGVAAADNDADSERRVAAAREENLKRLNRGRNPQSTEQRFIDAGFAPEVAAQLKRKLDEIEMQRLYLRDQAVREGWLGSTRYRDELRALSQRQNEMRAEMTPEDYDRYLYATGRPNRVTVNSVLSGSPADQSGLQPGDQILSYDGERIFSPGEIRRETTRGQSGSLVAVEVLRDGREEIVYIPRGPLGVQMGAMATRP